MATKIVDKLLPTTMVGSYPRPHWYKHQLLGRDIRVAFKEVQHEEAYHDAVATVIRDQESAGLDIVTDGNMWYDDYVGVIGAFCWYLYERIDGFEAAKEEHPSTVGLTERNLPQEMLHDWGAVSPTRFGRRPPASVISRPKSRRPVVTRDAWPWLSVSMSSTRLFAAPAWRSTRTSPNAMLVAEVLLPTPPL